MTKTITPVTTKALILSGNKELTQSVKNSLKSFEYGQIDSLENGIDALKQLGTSTYDLIVCHNKIKYISGWNFIKQMKNSDKIQNMPVVLMGEMPAPANDDELKAYGLVKYLKAPPSEAELTFLVNSTVQLFKTSGTIENKFTKAKSAAISQKSDQAIELYTELQGLTKKSLRSSLGLAEAYTQKGEIEKAESIIMESMKTESGDTTLALMQIKILLNRKQFDEARAAAEVILNPQVESPFYHVRVLNAYVDTKALEHSDVVCLDAMGKKFKLPEFWNTMARVHFQKSNFDASMLAVEESIATFGPTVELLNIKGACLKKANKLEDALRAYGDALKISPMDARVYFNMAICCIAMKSIQEARQHLEMCLKITPDFPNAKSKLDEVNKYLGVVA